MANENCSILINSCDSYEDIWTPFFSCFEEHWKNCPYPIYLNTETKSYEFGDLKIHSLHSFNKHCAWGERLRDCLSRINTEYVLMLFDDFCLENKVNQKEIELCLNALHENEDIDAFYIIHVFPELTENNNKKFVEVPRGKAYRLNSAPGVWRKSRLLEYTGKIDTPWAWEYYGTYRTEKLKQSKIYVLNALADLYPYNYRMGGAIHKGKWVKSVIEPINKKYNLNIDFSKRGFDDEIEHKVSFLYRLKFRYIGFRMLGLKALYIYIDRIIKRMIGKFKKTVSSI
ncbi:MAG: hypothetical protein IK024_12955 [Treponema sp.]|nr:hypothetical protein [Treponema sp.]